MADRISRREVLAMGAAASLATLAGCSAGDQPSTNASGVTGGPTSSTPTTARTPGPSVVDLPAYVPKAEFPEGVMSGDPMPTGVVLWTRVSASLLASGQELIAEMATDPAFANVVKTERRVPDPAALGSVKFVVEGLNPGSSYLYRFRVGEVVSPMGLTRTAPAPGAAVDQLRVGVFSCQRWTHGWFNAHADMAQQAPDVVICLGDYVYNTGAADGVTVPGRTDPIQDAKSFDEFRSKYEHYRSDPNLQAMHSRSPLIAIPDNHDGAPLPGDDMYPGAHKAFFEKMPVRDDPADALRTHRRFTWGSLVDLWMLDLQRYKTPGKRGSGNTDTDLAMMDPDVTYLGDQQRSWLFDGLADTKATWQILGSARQFSPLRIGAGGTTKVLNAGTYVNLDQWDGYQAERLRVLDEVKRLGRTGVVAVTGDMHWFWAADVPRDFNDPASPPVMVDLLCGGISSSNANEQIGDGQPQTKALLKAFGPPNANYVKYYDGDRHGYGLITFKSDRAEVEFRSPKTILEPSSPTEVLARFTLNPAKPGLKLTEGVDWDPSTGKPIGWPA